MTLVDTELGKVCGEPRGTHVAFRGLPFAKPPVGPLRFRAPEPAEPWTSVRDATRFAPAALQGMLFVPGERVSEGQSEDCLYLNVFTPAADSLKRPVMVFIHGGAFTLGSGSEPLYDGAKLAARHDVVVVTLNYRLGALGYLALGEAGARWGAVDNRGTLDQLAALRWVQRNIARFGGDPRQVTVFGESAGATSVCMLMALPEARGTFARAIVQSAPLALTLATADRAAPTTARYLTALGLTPETSERLLELPVEALHQAQLSLERDRSRWLHFEPVASPVQPGASIAAGGGSVVPLLIGYNRDEWNLFAAVDSRSWAQPLADSELTATLRRLLPHTDPSSLLAVYRSSRSERGLPHHNRALLRALQGDLYFRLPTLRFAELYREHADTYFYHFSYASPGLRGELGACHALELPFVFGTYDLPIQARFAGRGEGVAALSDAMMTAWTSFARGAPTWPLYGTARETMEFDLASQLVNDPLAEERVAWDGVY